MPLSHHRRNGFNAWLSGMTLALAGAFSPLTHAAITSLEAIQSIPTTGAQDMEPFTINGTRYLAAANQHRTTNYALDSKIYRWSGANYFEVQAIPTLGAADWEAFSVGGEDYLAVANTYNGTTYSIDSVVYRWNGTEFVHFQSIPTVAAVFMETFTMDGELYMAVANGFVNGSSVSKIYRWEGTGFAEFQSIPTLAAAHWKHFTIDGQHYLALANHQDGSGNYQVDSMIYRWDGTQFVEYQVIPTSGARAWESIVIDGEHFLVVANYWNNSSYNIDSMVYRWNGSRFTPFQGLRTHGATTPVGFETGGEHYLTISNRTSGATRNLTSFIYRWDGSQFVADQSYPTIGSLSVNVYEEGGVSYLAVSNTEVNATTYDLNSVIYRINATQLPVADFTADTTTGSAPFTVTLDASTATDPDGGAIVDYQWSSSDAQSATGSTASFTFDVAGSYSVTLTVTDDEGESAQQTIDIQVDAAVAGDNCEGRASYSAVDGRLHLPLMEIATVPLLGASDRPAGDSSVPTTTTLRIIPGTTLFEIESVVSATPDPAAIDTCHADYSIDGVLTIPLVDVPVVTSIGGMTVTTGVDTFGATLELLPMSDLFTLTEIRQLP